ncbi:helix-turn-helix transcriptional regulator [Kitasatospora aureofaciens]|uniref:helix-turn-helix transcriptional regulator n=1 Tax=Kitasatospora aureofaciens TaxID=1894 RepID=UPI0033F4D452
MLAPAGAATELDDRDRGPNLQDGAELWTLVANRPVVSGYDRFLWIDPARRCHRVELVPCPRGSFLVTERLIDFPHALTARELQVLHLITLGASNAEIAAQLVVSHRTVATHVEHVLEKLRGRTRAALAATAVRDGLLLAQPSRARIR